jgi:hypothetical protein
LRCGRDVPTHEPKPPGAVDRLLVLALAACGPLYPPQKPRAQLLARSPLADLLGVRDRRQRQPSGDAAARCLTHPSLQFHLALSIAGDQRPQPFSRSGRDLLQLRGKLQIRLRAHRIHLLGVVLVHLMVNH